MKWLFLFLIVLGAGVLELNAGEYNFKYIDEYLANWDRFANGKNDLVSYLKENNQKFEVQLATALRANDKKAPARMVFYSVVQVGGFISKGTELGKAVGQIVGPNFPTINNEEGLEAYFAGDLYFWWQENRSKYEPYPIFEAWLNREFARQTVIPMYTSVVTKRRNQK